MNLMFREPTRRAATPDLVDRELTLGEMLADPIVVRMMRRDGVTRAQVVDLFVPARGRLCRAA